MLNIYKMPELDKMPEKKIKKEMSDEELDSLTSAIKMRYGMDFTNYEKASLKRGFTRLIQKHELDSVIGLWTKIMKDRLFLHNSIDELTVNLTELFRNPEIWIKLKNDILPKLKTNIKLDVWHAGCSSGEEVYTMAMVLHDLNQLSRANLLATDLSRSILEQAKKGEYSNIVVNRYVKSYQKYSSNRKMEDLFEVEESVSTIQDKYKKNIQFQQHNLVHDGMDKKFDIIFCRNVMIYFDDVLKMKVLKLFHNCLKEGGYFIIGYYDMLPSEHSTLFSTYDSTTRVYIKKKL